MMLLQRRHMMLLQRHSYDTIYNLICRQASNTRRTLVGNKSVDRLGVAGASGIGAAPKTYSFSY